MYTVIESIDNTAPFALTVRTCTGCSNMCGIFLLISIEVHLFNLQLLRFKFPFKLFKPSRRSRSSVCATSADLLTQVHVLEPELRGENLGLVRGDAVCW